MSQQSTPSAAWHAAGEPDPHGTSYNCERADLCMGSLTDDELANGAFLNYDVRPPLQDIVDGKAFSPIAWMTAVKDRIRWLSRALAALREENERQHERLARVAKALRIAGCPRTDADRVLLSFEERALALSAKVADLEAQLAAVQGGEAVGTFQTAQGITGHFILAEHSASPDFKLRSGDKLYTHPVSDEQQAKDAWQPIETAPKDGTHVIVYHHTPSMQPEQYGLVRVAWWATTVWTDHLGALLCGKYHPTHWQPLPAPPASSTEEKTHG